MDRKQDDVQGSPSQVGFAANQVEPDDMAPSADTDDPGTGGMVDDRSAGSEQGQRGSNGG